MSSHYTHCRVMVAIIQMGKLWAKNQKFKNAQICFNFTSTSHGSEPDPSKRLGSYQVPAPDPDTDPVPELELELELTWDFQ